MIAGEIKRFLRDDGILKVSRSLKENYYHVYQCKEQLEVLYGREPTVTELAGILKLPVEELVMTLDAAQEVVSLHRTVYQGDGNDISLMDRIPDKENPQEKMLNRILLEQILGELEGKDRTLIYMRYFQELTQSQIADRLGISQVQVSRMEKRILNRLHERWGRK